MISAHTHACTHVVCVCCTIFALYSRVSSISLCSFIRFIFFRNISSIDKKKTTNIFLVTKNEKRKKNNKIYEKRRISLASIYLRRGVAPNILNSGPNFEHVHTESIFLLFVYVFRWKIFSPPNWLTVDIENNTIMLANIVHQFWHNTSIPRNTMYIILFVPLYTLISLGPIYTIHSLMLHTPHTTQWIIIIYSSKFYDALISRRKYKRIKLIKMQSIYLFDV